MISLHHIFTYFILNVSGLKINFYLRFFNQSLCCFFTFFFCRVLNINIDLLTSINVLFLVVGGAESGYSRHP